MWAGEDERGNCAAHLLDLDQREDVLDSHGSCPSISHRAAAAGKAAAGVVPKLGRPIRPILDRDQSSDAERTCARVPDWARGYASLHGMDQI